MSKRLTPVQLLEALEGHDIYFTYDAETKQFYDGEITMTHSRATQVLKGITSNKRRERLKRTKSLRNQRFRKYESDDWE